MTHFKGLTITITITSGGLVKSLVKGLAKWFKNSYTLKKQ